MKRALTLLSLTFVLLFSGFAAPAHAQGRANQPIITGTKATSMDAPESDEQLEHYAHSSVVKYLAGKVGISTPEMARIFEDFNSGVLIAIILYFVLTRVPKSFSEKRRKLAEDLVEARKATENAEKRLTSVEARLQSLGGEIEEMRGHAAEIAQGEEARIRAAMEAERERIVHSAEAEIEAAQSNAERGLKRYAADLAVDRATERVSLDTEGDRMLVDEFLQSLGSRLSKERN